MISLAFQNLSSLGMIYLEQGENKFARLIFVLLLLRMAGFDKADAKMPNKFSMPLGANACALCVASGLWIDFAADRVDEFFF